MLDLTLEQLQFAWEHVRENDGCAGVDGVTIARYENQAQAGLPELLQRATNGAYVPLPLRKIVVEKKAGSGQQRTLLVPAVRDRILQTAVARMVSRSWEQEFLDVSYAYRPGRGVDRAVARILQLRERGWRYVLEADIVGYFDRISHARMLRILRNAGLETEAERLLRLWVKAEMWDGSRVTRLRRGIAQGSPISPLLANYFLRPFDERLEKSDNRLIRYGDDFVVLCQSPEQAEAALNAVSGLLAASGLELNQEKTGITDFSAGFEFLGVRFGEGQPMIPWKANKRMGRVSFLARPMPPRLLKGYHVAESEVGPPKRDAEAKPTSSVRAMPEIVGAEDMAFIYITQQGSVVRKSGDRFLVEVDQKVALDIPYHRLEQILVFGNVQLTTQAITEALDKGIGISFFTRHGRYMGALQAPPGRNVTLRLSQYRLYEDHERSLGIAGAIVRRKIGNGLGVLKRYQDRRPHEDASAARRAVMVEMQGKVDKAKSLAEVDGCEGMAARNYFEALMEFNRSEFTWPGRVKHPATDPLNALLSLAYTLLQQEMAALIEAAGLDPAIGMLHEVDGSRPSLALDLVEAFRHPIADRYVRAQVNRSVFQGRDFEQEHGDRGLLLKSAALRRFFEDFEKWMLGGKLSYRQRLREEVERFAGSLREGVAWNPFAFDEPAEAVATVKWLACYDIADDARRQRVVKVLLDYGERVQESLFWVDAEEDLVERMRERLARAISGDEDSLWLVPLLRCVRPESGGDGREAGSQTA